MARMTVQCAARIRCLLEAVGPLMVLNPPNIIIIVIVTAIIMIII